MSKNNYVFVLNSIARYKSSLVLIGTTDENQLVEYLAHGVNLEPGEECELYIYENGNQMLYVSSYEDILEIEEYERLKYIDMDLYNSMAEMILKVEKKRKGMLRDLDTFKKKQIEAKEKQKINEAKNKK